MDSSLWINLVLLALVTVVAVSVVVVRNLLAATMLAGIYSLLMSLVWVDLAAMDVAFTEAAVGAGISTILFIGAIVCTGSQEKPQPALHLPALVLVTLIGAALGYGTMDMPAFGDGAAPIHWHVVPEYSNQNVGKLDSTSVGERAAGEDFGHHVPNLVTGILADYRGYDTLFETAVIFTASICVLLLLRSVATTGRASPPATEEIS